MGHTRDLRKFDFAAADIAIIDKLLIQYPKDLVLRVFY